MDDAHKPENPRPDSADTNEPVRSSDLYRQTFLIFSEKLERLIRGAAVTLLILMLIAQALLQWPALRRLLVEVEQLEGVPYSPANSTK